MLNLNYRKCLHGVVVLGLMLATGSTSAATVELWYKGLPYDPGTIIPGDPTGTSPVPRPGLDWHIRFDDSALKDNELKTAEISFFSTSSGLGLDFSSPHDCDRCSFFARLMFQPDSFNVTMFDISASLSFGLIESNSMDGDVVSGPGGIPSGRTRTPGKWITAAPVPLAAATWVWLTAFGLLVRPVGRRQVAV